MDGNVSAHYTGALVRTLGLLRQRGLGAEIHFEIGNSLIADARNKLVSKFLATDARDLVFVDSDLAWKAEDFVRLMSAPHAFVAGVYQRKSRTKIDFAVKFGPTIAMDEHRLMEVERVGTGFMRLRRDCIEKMVAAHPQLGLRNPSAPDDLEPVCAVRHGRRRRPVHRRGLHVLRPLARDRRPGDDRPGHRLRAPRQRRVRRAAAEVPGKELKPQAVSVTRAKLRLPTCST